MSEPFYRRHRGPFRLHVTRPYATKPDFIRGEWLKGTLDGEDVAAECAALLADPRDRISSVQVWSEPESQFVMSYPTHERQSA